MSIALAQAGSASTEPTTIRRMITSLTRYDFLMRFMASLAVNPE